MSDEQNIQPGAVIVTDVPVAASPVVDAIEPTPDSQVVVPTVTHESLLTELVAAVKKCARGVSHEIEDVLARAEKHFGL